MNRSQSIGLLILVLAPLALASACASESPRDLKLAPASALPPEIQKQPATVREAYQFAIANPDALKNIPCYCGCGSVGHTSNYMCYIKEVKANGAYVFDDHALG
jgi:hypothetical protein